MKMLLGVRAEPDLARAQMMMWHMRQIRWRKCVRNLRKAQMNDQQRDAEYQGMTPFVYHKTMASPLHPNPCHPEPAIDIVLTHRPPCAGCEEHVH